MNFFSIVCEFNPFHTGHKYLIEQTRKATNADAIVCIMSGSMVQRGDVAVYDKWTRAKSAIDNGADLVIELPVCYVLQSADMFARGAVQIADAIGSKGLAFGSECPDTDLLWSIARVKHSQDTQYTTALKNTLADGMGYPAACAKALQSVLGNLPEEAYLPNTTLATSYLTSILDTNPSLEVYIEKRLGSYHSNELDCEFPSATAIREAILSGDKIDDFSLCTSEIIYDINKLSAHILAFFRTCDEEKLTSILGMENGLAQKLIQESKACTSFDELVGKCTTKRYTAHRIRRVILASVLGITDAPTPQYARVLALNSKGAAILREIKKNGNIEVITKITNSTMNEMLKKDILATDIAAICANQKASMDYTTSPYVKD